MSLLNVLSVLLQAEERYLFRSEKIFTVLTVVLIIWGGILAYLFLTDRKLDRMEKKLREKNPS